MDNNLAQSDEICALESIYQEDDVFSFDKLTKSGSFFCKIKASSEFHVQFEDENRSLTLNYLPPIKLDFQFPIDYPSQNPPKFKLTCRWLSLKNVKI